MPLSELVYSATVAFLTTERVDERICIKFYLKLGHSSAETIRMIKKAFGDDSMSEAQKKLWYRRFKDGQESVEGDHVLEGLQQDDHPKMLDVCGWQSTKIGN